MDEVKIFCDHSKTMWEMTDILLTSGSFWQKLPQNCPQNRPWNCLKYYPFLTYKLLNRWLLEFFHWDHLISSWGPNRYPPVHQYPCGNTNGPGWVGRVIPGQNRVGGSFHDIDWRGPRQHFFSLKPALFHLKHAVKEQQYPEN